jgi:hypothetical protein
MELLDEINDLLAEIEQTFQDMQSAVSSALAQVPGWLGWVRDRIVDAWNYVCEKVSEFWAYLEETTGREIGDPGMLSWAAVRWAGDVGGPVSEQVAVADAGNLEADNVWSGDSAEAYRERLLMHKLALTAVQATLTKGISGALDKVQSALEVYYGVIITALVTLIGVLIGAIASLATGPGVVVGLVAAGVGIVAAITAIALGRVYLESDCRSAKTTLENLINDSTAFGGDHWPAGAAS